LVSGADLAGVLPLNLRDESSTRHTCLPGSVRGDIPAQDATTVTVRNGDITVLPKIVIVRSAMSGLPSTSLDTPLRRLVGSTGGCAMSPRRPSTVHLTDDSAGHLNGGFSPILDQEFGQHSTR